ncbi:MAG: cytochrome c peroxidase [Acidobacteriota bacterium]
MNAPDIPSQRRILTTLALVALLIVAGAQSHGELLPTSWQVELEMAAQQAAFATLISDRDLTDPPAGVDPARWQRMFSTGAPSHERIELGRRLFFEPKLSRDHTVSCASCHDVRRAFADGEKLARGIEGRVARRNTPTVINTGLLKPLFWDGRAETLEQQAELPLLAPSEMDMPDLVTAYVQLLEIESYRVAFIRAFGRVEPRDLLVALADFQRSLVFLDSPFDRYLEGDEGALTADEIAGWELFRGRALCSTCHLLGADNNLATDQQFHNVGIAAEYAPFDELSRTAHRRLARTATLAELDGIVLETPLSLLGRFLVTRDPADLGAFRTPSLRNVSLTAPYMHDGSIDTLWEAVRFYIDGGNPNPYLSETLLPVDLSDREIDQLVAFLFTLTDVHWQKENRREFERQRRIWSRDGF